MAMPSTKKRNSHDGTAGPARAARAALPLRAATYTLLPLRIPPTPTISSSSPRPWVNTLATLGSIHYLFLRTDTKQQRTLFIANLPTDATERHLRILFKNAGAIQHISFALPSTIPLASRHAPNEGTWGAAQHDPDGASSSGEDDDKGTTETAQQARRANHLLQHRLGNTDGKHKKRSKRSKDDDDQEDGPQLIPLPPLDPRQRAGAQPLLPTGTSAHLVFLDDSSLTRALAQAEDTSAAFAAAGGPSLFHDDDDEAPGDRKGEGRDGATGRSKAAILAALKAARAWPLDPYSASSSSSSSQAQAQAQAPPAPGLPTLLASHTTHRPSLESIKHFSDARIHLHLYLRAHPEHDPTSLPARQRRVQGGAGIQAVRVGDEGELLDADGFTIVTAGGKYGRAAEAGARARAGSGVGGQGASVRVARNRPHMASGAAYEAAALASGTAKRRQKKSKSKDLEDFYRFQTREKNREKLAQLRAKFQEDKLKVAKLKESRKFKPY